MNGDKDNKLLILPRQTEKLQSHVTFLGSSDSGWDPSSRPAANQPCFNALILNLCGHFVWPSSILRHGKSQHDLKGWTFSAWWKYNFFVRLLCPYPFHFSYPSQLFTKVAGQCCDISWTQVLPRLQVLSFNIVRHKPMLHHCLVLTLSPNKLHVVFFNELWAVQLILILSKHMNIDNNAGFFLLMPGVHSSWVIHEFLVK